MLLKLDVCVASHKGDRQYQQDRCAVLNHPMYPSIYMAVVADGMGGSTGGAEAASQVLFSAKDYFERYRPKSDSSIELLNAIMDSGHRLIRAGRFIQDTEPHSTAAILLLQDDEAMWAHAGDSRIFYFTQNHLESFTEDHSVVAELLRQEKITEEQSLVHPHRSMLLSCLGAQKEPIITITEPIKIKPNDKFMMCSDGIWGYFLQSEIEQAMVNNEPKAAAQFLFKKARERAGGYGDNLSIISIKIAEVEEDESQQMKDFNEFFKDPAANLS